MPKMKTKRGAAKRFTLKASGAIKNRRANRNHINTKMPTKAKRRLRVDGKHVECGGDKRHIRRLLCVE